MKRLAKWMGWAFGAFLLLGLIGLFVPDQKPKLPRQYATAVYAENNIENYLGTWGGVTLDDSTDAICMGDTSDGAPSSKTTDAGEDTYTQFDCTINVTDADGIDHSYDVKVNFDTDGYHVKADKS